MCVGGRGLMSGFLKGKVGGGAMLIDCGDELCGKYFSCNSDTSSAF